MTSAATEGSEISAGTNNVNQERCGNTPDRESVERPGVQRQVVADPKGMLEKHLGRTLPPNLTITVHEEDSNTLHFSLPPAASSVSELSDDELEKVSGVTEVIVDVAIGVVIGTVLGTAAGSVGASAAVTASKGW